MKAIGCASSPGFLASLRGQIKYTIVRRGKNAATHGSGRWPLRIPPSVCQSFCEEELGQVVFCPGVTTRDEYRRDVSPRRPADAR